MAAYLMLLVHLNTQDVKYLNVSRRMADYFLNNIPSDGIVPWYVCRKKNLDYFSLTVFASGISMHLLVHRALQTHQQQLSQPRDFFYLLSRSLIVRNILM